MRPAILFVLSLVLAACVSSHVLVGTPRPAISPDQVKIYLHPPTKYEEIAILQSSSKHSFTFSAQGKTDKVIERLKGEAAELGANGLLLQGVGDQQVGAVGGAYGSATASGNSAFGFGLGSSAAVYAKAGNGLAIYVTQD